MAAGFGARPQLAAGPDVEEITTELLGFTSLGGASKLKLLPTPWPTNNLPPPTSSLFSIASKQGLLAAAGPDAVVIATTESVRKALQAESSSESKVLPFTPQLTVPTPFRISHVCFTSDGTYLMLSAENGGGLAVYETSKLKQGNKEPSFQIGTDNVAVRSIVPNPATENAHVVAVVLSAGQLMMADLQAKTFVTGSSGSKLIRNGTSCVAWSVKGKQVVAGLGDGTACQLDPLGTVKAMIPKPPNVDGDQHVSDLVWLSNDEFLMVHTPSSSSDPDRAPDSTLNFVRTNKERSEFSFSRFGQDPAPPFGLNRSPPTHYFSRIRGWHHLVDTLIVSSVASPDVGLITKSDLALSSDVAADRITNTYTCTSFALDSSRATLPMASDEMGDTSPIGMGIDLSVTEKARKPITGDEMEWSPFSIPALMLLNHEGLLCSWWFVYSSALQEGVQCSSMISSTSSDGNMMSPTSPVAQTPQQQTSAFGSTSSPAGVFGSTPGSTSAFGGFPKPAAAAFGQTGFGGASTAKPSPWGASPAATNITPAASSTAFGKSAFGQAAFGQSSTFGQSSSGSSAFGKPAFGQSAGGAASTSAFGASGGFGQTQSPWAAKASAPASTTTQPAAAFGQSAFSKFAGSTPAASPFGGLSSSTTASPFGQPAKQGQSVFGSSSNAGRAFGATPEPSFGSTVTIGSSNGGSTVDSSKSIFGAPPTSMSLFGAAPSTQTSVQSSDMMDEAGEDAPKKTNPMQAATPKEGGLFGMTGSSFHLGSTFKPGQSAAEKDQESSSAKTPGRLFGSNFGLSLDQTVDSKASPFGKLSSTTATKESPLNTFSVSAKTGSTPSTAVDTSPAKAPKETTSMIAPPTMQMPEPPQVTSKPIPSPASAPTPSTAKSLSSAPSPARGGTPPIDMSAGNLGSSPSTSERRGSDFTSGSGGGASDISAEAVPLGSDDETDLADEVESLDENHDPGDIMPPDPNTVKKPDWFYDAPPGATHGGQQPVAPTPMKKTQPGSNFSPARIPAFRALDTSTTPAGLPKMKIHFDQPPPTIAESPRSPSPVRSTSSPMLGRMPDMPQMPKLQSYGTLSPLAKAEVYAADLQDDADEEVRKYLAQSVEPDADIDKLQFVASQASTEHGGRPVKEGVPSQIERVSRDINSMVDTLGLNSRYLANFVAGQSTFADSHRGCDDLVKGDQWIMEELQTLTTLESEIEQNVDATSFKDTETTIRDLLRTKKEMLKMREDLVHIRHFLIERRDPDNVLAARSNPLPSVHQAKQLELRNALAIFQKQLAEAESASLMLRTRVASAIGKKDKRALPTVEAVENTIKKMIGMIQQRSSEVDVLEAQMRKLGLASRSGTPSRDADSLRESLRRSVGPDDSMLMSFRKMGLNGSREGTPIRDSTTSLLRHSLRPYSTPQKNDGRQGYSLSLDDSDDENVAESTEQPAQSVEVGLFLIHKAKRQTIIDVLKKKLMDRAQGIKAEPRD